MTQAHDPAAGPPALSAPRLDLGIALVLAISACFLASAWWRESGYQIADSVEYMERAQALVRGEALIDNRAIRAFGFSGLLIPILAVADWFGVENWIPVLHACQFLQIALSLALVYASARLGMRLAGNAGGLAAGLLVGLNPTLLRWGVEPVSGVASALFVTLAVITLFDRRTKLSGLIAGAWLGAAILMAYQTFSVAIPVVAFVVVRDARRARGHALAVVVGVIACVLLQCVLDRLYYGEFGASVMSYLYQNFGFQFARIIIEIARFTGSDTLEEVAQWLYNKSLWFDPNDYTIKYQQSVKEAGAAIYQSRSMTWYLENITHGVPAPALGLMLIGAIRTLFLRNWKAWLVLFVVVVELAVYAMKASKDFRLWLPFLPLLMALAGLGCATIAGSLADPARRVLTPRFVLALAIVAMGGIVGVMENRSTNTRRFAAFWQAMDFVNGNAREEWRAAKAAGEEPRRDRVGCAYHWAVFLRSAAEVELIKLPHHLDYWKEYSAEQRQNDLNAISSFEWFITHLPILTEFRELMDLVNREFAVQAIFYDRVSYEGLGPIYVLRKRKHASGEKTFFDLTIDSPLEDYAREHELDLSRSVDFCGARDGKHEPMLRLIDWKYERVAGDGHGWITYTWQGGPFDGRELVLIDRLTDRKMVNSWQNNHAPAYGMHPTSTWGAGWILREGYLVVAEADAYRADGPSRFLGGDFRRGDLIPATLWIDAARLDAEGRVVERLESCDEDGRLLRARALAGRPPRPHGEAISHDGMTRIGSFWLPVHASSRYPDDGTVVPAEQ